MNDVNEKRNMKSQPNLIHLDVHCIVNIRAYSRIIIVIIQTQVKLMKLMHTGNKYLDESVILLLGVNYSDDSGYHIMLVIASH